MIINCLFLLTLPWDSLAQDITILSKTAVFWSKSPHHKYFFFNSKKITNFDSFAGSPSPLVPRMILQLHNWYQINNQVLDVQEKLAMVAFAYQLMPSNAEWTCIAWFLPSSHVQCQLCRSGTYHNRWSTWKMKIILFTPVSCTSRN